MNFVFGSILNYFFLKLTGWFEHIMLILFEFRKLLFDRYYLHCTEWRFFVTKSKCQ